MGRKRGTPRTTGMDPLDVQPAWPTPGTPGGWLDPFDDYGREAIAARAQVQRELDELRRAIAAAREEAAAETRHIA